MRAMFVRIRDEAAEKLTERAHVTRRDARDEAALILERVLLNDAALVESDTPSTEAPE